MRLISLALFSLLTGCMVGEAPSGVVGTPDAAVGGSHDGGGGGTSDAPASGTDAAVGTDAGSAGFACRNQVTANLPDGHHNAGQDCMNGCHNHGFTLSGTLYASVNGGAAIAGGSITVVDANGATFDMVSASDGNFYTSQAIAFPIKVTASECPAVSAMSAAVTSGQGGCNKTGCHTAGGAGRIHLP